MPNVPVYNKPQVQQQGFPNVRVASDAPRGAFGADQSDAAVTGSLQKLGGDIFRDMKQEADTTASVAYDTKLSEIHTNIQKGVANLKGEDAMRAPDFARETWEKEVAKLDGALVNPEQKMFGQKAAAAQWQSLNRSTEMHANAQIHEFKNKTFDSAITQARNHAALNASDDTALAETLEKQRVLIAEQGKLNGWGEGPVLAQKAQEALSSTHRAVIGARIGAGNAGGATAYFEKHKGEMTQQDLEYAVGTLETGTIIADGNAAWEKVKNLRFSDGAPNEVAMRAAIMATPGFTDKHKESVFSFVKARAGEEIANNARRDSAKLTSFQNEIAKAFKQGVTMDQALASLPDKYAKNALEKAAFVQAVVETWGPPKVGDPSVNVALGERIREGGSSVAQIDKLYYVDKKLSSKEWEQHRADFYRISSEGADPLTKQAWERVNIMADEKFGRDKLSKDKFKNVVSTLGRGKSADEILAIADDRLKIEENTKSSFLGFEWGGKAKWQVDDEKMTGGSISLGTVKTDIGNKEVEAIARGALSTGKDGWGIKDVEEFAGHFGGYDQIQPGTKVHDAIRVLIRGNKLVTPETVKMYLERQASR